MPHGAKILAVSTTGSMCDLAFDEGVEPLRRYAERDYLLRGAPIARLSARKALAQVGGNLGDDGDRCPIAMLGGNVEAGKKLAQGGKIGLKPRPTRDRGGLGLSRRGAFMKNLAHSTSLNSCVELAPPKLGIKYLV
jgi:hypothetical protein